MATLKSNVKIDNRFGKITRDYDRALQRALADAARAGAQVASAKAQERKQTGKMAEIKVAAVRQGRKGPNVLFASTPFYAAFQEFGTLGNRKRKLKQERRTTPTGEGVPPLRFMGKGRTAARKLLLPLIQRHMGRVR